MSSPTVNQRELIALGKQLRDAIKVIDRLVAKTRKDDVSQFIQVVTNKTAKDVLSELDAGADPNAVSGEGEPVILIAASRGRPGHAIVAALLAAGANVDATDDEGNTALISNSRDEDLPLVRTLVEAGADVNRSNDHGDTPLTNAAAWGAARVVKYLLSQGADPNKRDGAGVSAADLAAQQGHKTIESILLRKQKRTRS